MGEFSLSSFQEGIVSAKLLRGKCFPEGGFSPVHKFDPIFRDPLLVDATSHIAHCTNECNRMFHRMFHICLRTPTPTLVLRETLELTLACLMFFFRFTPSVIFLHFFQFRGAHIARNIPTAQYVKCLICSGEPNMHENTVQDLDEHNEEGSEGKSVSARNLAIKGG